MYRVRRLIAKSWCLSRLFCWLHGIPLEGHPQDEIWYFAYGANMHDSGVYFKPPFPRSARAAAFREAVNSAVFGDNPPLSMTIHLESVRIASL